MTRTSAPIKQKHAYLYIQIFVIEKYMHMYIYWQLCELKNNTKILQQRGGNEKSVQMAMMHRFAGVNTITNFCCLLILLFQQHSFTKFLLFYVYLTASTPVGEICHFQKCSWNESTYFPNNFQQYFVSSPQCLRKQ